MKKAILFLLGLMALLFIGCATTGSTSTHYGVSVHYGSPWGYYNHHNYHHYRPPMIHPRPPRPPGSGRPPRPTPLPSGR